MSEQDKNQEMIAKIVSAFASRPDVSVDEIAELTKKLAGTFDEAGERGGNERISDRPAEKTPSTPAIPIENAVTRSKVYCLCCGKGFKMLKRHIGAEHGLTEAAYRETFGLPDDFALVAPDYSELKAKTAKKLGLGTYDRTSPKGATEATP